MFAFRCTKKLIQKLGLPVIPDPPPPTTRLGDWYGNVLNAGRQRLMIFVSDRSLLSIVMPLRERHDLLKNFKLRLAMQLLHLDIDAQLVSTELDQMETVVIAPTANRSVLGSMNDFSIMAKDHLYYKPDMDHHHLSRILGKTPCSPLDYNSPERLAPELLSEKR
ncbi:MAG: hypothetical protein P1S60_02550 [Anaerolineae bacterium]|nr:hypothetical protein [Anaerolineae bacterium]